MQRHFLIIAHVAFLTLNINRYTARRGFASYGKSHQCTLINDYALEDLFSGWILGCLWGTVWYKKYLTVPVLFPHYQIYPTRHSEVEPFTNAYKNKHPNKGTNTVFLILKKKGDYCCQSLFVCFSCTSFFQILFETYFPCINSTIHIFYSINLIL